MITVIRKNQKTLMIIVTVVVIIAFAWLYNGTEFEKLGANNIGTVYGQTVTRTDVQRRARLFELAASLGLFDLISGLGGRAASRDQAVEAFIFNGMVLDHEARLLQIQPTDAQVAEVVRSLPVFQTNGRFDLQRYTQFIERTLAPNGLTEAQLEEVIRAQLQLREVTNLLGTSAETSPAEIRAEWERRNRVFSTAIIRFPLAEFETRVEPTDAEIEAFYEERKSTLMTPEERTVLAVEFLLPEEARESEGSERIKALQKVADSAGQFTQDVLEPGADFEAVARAHGVEPVEYGPFTRGEPPARFADVPTFTEAAFALTEQDPDSDAVQTDNGFVVLHLDSITPSRQQSLEEARDRVITLIKQTKGRELAAAKAAEAAAKIRAAMASQDRTFTEAAADLGLNPTKLPEFSLSNPALDIPEAASVFQEATELASGEVSGFIETGEGGFLLHLASADLPDEAAFESQKEPIARSLIEQERQIAFYQWLDDRVRAADIQGI